MEGLALFLMALFLYFAPTAIAYYRDHRNFTPIFLLNFFLGWTLLGWLASLIWSFTSNVEQQYAPRQAPPRVKCPDCAELILADAKVCKHCGTRLPKIDEDASAAA